MCLNRQRFVLQSARLFFSTVSIILCRGNKMLCVCFLCKFTLLNSVSTSSSFFFSVLQLSFLLNNRRHSLTRFEICRRWFVSHVYSFGSPFTKSLAFPRMTSTTPLQLYFSQLELISLSRNFCSVTFPSPVRLCFSSARLRFALLQLIASFSYCGNIFLVICFIENFSVKIRYA